MAETDLISRQAAIEALKRAEALTRAFGYHVVIDTIRELPSAQQKVRKVDPDTLRPEEKEEPDCKYYHGDLDGRCFGQKGAPACPCGGVSRRCDAYAD